MRLAPIQSLAQLKAKMGKDQRYQTLAITSAESLGGTPTDSKSAYSYLLEVSNDEGEDFVVEEVNSNLELKS